MSSTQAPPRPDTSPAPPAQHRPGMRISATQLIASALAAVTATIAASYLGVSGTVIGAALASVVTVIGNTVYSHSIRQTGNRVRTVVPVGARWAPRAAGSDLSPAPNAVPRRQRERGKATSLRVLAVACAGVFGAVLVLVTGVELVVGQPLSDLVRGKAGHGTSVFGTTAHRAQGQLTRPTPQPATTPTVTVTAKVVTTTPTVTVMAPPVTATATPSQGPTGTTHTSTPAPSTTPLTSTPSP